MWSEGNSECGVEGTVSVEWRERECGVEGT